MYGPIGRIFGGNRHQVSHKKISYGLKQAPRMWNKFINAYFLSLFYAYLLSSSSYSSHDSDLPYVVSLKNSNNGHEIIDSIGLGCSHGMQCS